MNYSDIYFSSLNIILKNNSNFFSLNESKILITGATGLIGSTIADLILYFNMTCKGTIKLYLAGRNKEKIVKRFSYYKESIDYNFCKYDSSKPIIFKDNFDYIIHCASNSDPTKIGLEPVETIIANVSSVYDLLNYHKKHKGKTFLFVSSSEIYGINNTNKPFNEKDFGYIDITSPRACYPTSKRCGESLCISFSNEYNLDVKIVRPGHIYGPQMLLTDSRASAQFIHNVLDKKDIIMKSEGEQLRSYCYSLDCASAIITVLFKGINRCSYNISNRDSICTIKDFAECLAKISKQKIIFELPSSEELKNYNFMLNSTLNSTALEKLNWKGLFSLEDGIKNTLDILNND